MSYCSILSTWIYHHLYPQLLAGTELQILPFGSCVQSYSYMENGWTNKILLYRTNYLDMANQLKKLITYFETYNENKMLKIFSGKICSCQCNNCNVSIYVGKISYY